MKIRQVSNGYILVLQKGEKLVDTLSGVCADKNIKAGYLSGLGAVTEAELGFYDLDAKKYHWKMFNGLFEITNLNGTVSYTTLHIHITLAGKDYQAIGGHLKEATVGGTCEVYIQVFEDSFVRKFDSTTGLNLLQL